MVKEVLSSLKRDFKNSTNTPIIAAFGLSMVPSRNSLITKDPIFSFSRAVNLDNYNYSSFYVMDFCYNKNSFFKKRRN